MIQVRYPRGPMPARGFRCPVCGEETLLLSDAEKADELARTIGLFGVDRLGTRTIIRAGNSVAVTLDPDLVADVLKGAKPGTKVRVGRMGGRIVIEPMEP